MDYVITFSDVMAGVITLGLGVITFFIKGWFNNLKSSTEEIKSKRTIASTLSAKSRFRGFS